MARARSKTARPVTPVYHPGPLIVSESALAEATAALLDRDPQTIGHLLAVGGSPPLRWREPGFEGLVTTIVSQQVSVASAKAISLRLLRAFSPLLPATVAGADDAALRACGLSGGKIRTLRSLSEAIQSGGLDLAALGAIPPEAAHRALVAVKGIGPWTADIFLLSCLGHPDAWPCGDLALQEAARIALELDTRPNARALDRLGERWRPHRGVVARMLWAYYRANKQGRDGIILVETPSQSLTG